MIFSSSHLDRFVPCPICGKSVNQALWIKCDKDDDENGNLHDGPYVCPDIGDMQQLAREHSKENNLGWEEE